MLFRWCPRRCGSRSQLAAENLFLRKLAKRVFQTFDAPLDLSMLRDEYVEGLQTVIEGQISRGATRHLRLTRE